LLSPVADHVLLDPTAFSFSAHNNHAVREAEMWLGYTTAFLCFLNDDVIVRRGWLEDMLACYAQEDACAVGMKLVYPDYMDLAGRIQHCGVERGPFRTGAHRGVCADPDSPPFSEPRWVRTWAVTGACLLVSSEDFWTYGPFDKGYEDESQDTDLCMRLKHGTGSDCYVVQSNHCWHEELATRGPVTSASLVGGDPGESVDAMAVLTRRLRDTARFIERWGSED